MQQSTQENTGSLLAIPEIEAIINLLLSQVTAYVVENFTHPDAKTAIKENIHDVLSTLSKDPRALSSAEPASDGLLNKASSLLSSTAAAVSRAALSPLTRYVDPNQPFHRLRHLLYFAGKAQELKQLIEKLQAFAALAPKDVEESNLSAFTKNCTDLIEGVGEFFKSANELVSTSSGTTIVASYQGYPFNLDGMKGPGGKSSLADMIITNILKEYLDIQKLIKLTSQIESQKQSVLSRIAGYNGEETKQAAMHELEREAKAKEIALERALREDGAKEIAKEKALRETREKEMAQEMARIKAEEKLKEIARERDLTEARETSAREKALSEAREKEMAQKMTQERSLREGAEKELKKMELELRAARENQLNQERKDREDEQSKLAFKQMKDGVNAYDNMGFNTLHRAIKANDPVQVANALRSGANANIKTSKGLSPLCLALIYDDNKCQSLSTTIDESTVNIVGQLLRNKAVPNEFITALNRNFIHFLLFKSYNLSAIEDPQLRSEPKCELIKLFLLHGCAFDGGNPRCGSDIGKYIDNKKLTLKQERAKEILVTFKRFSVAELSTLLDWQYETLERYQTLASRQDSETAIKHMIVIKPLYERYSFIFDLFLSPHKRNEAIEQATTLIKMLSAERMAADIDRLQALGRESQSWLNKQPKQQPRGIDSFFVVDSAAVARENQLYLQTIIQNLIKCIEKAMRMHEPRWVEGKNDRQLCILTPLEIEVIDLNFQQAHQIFSEHLEKKRVHEQKQVDLAIGKG